MHPHTHLKAKSGPWNKGKLVGQKPPLKLKEVSHVGKIASRAIVMQQ